MLYWSVAVVLYNIAENNMFVGISNPFTPRHVIIDIMSLLPDIVFMIVVVCFHHKIWQHLLQQRQP